MTGHRYWIRRRAGLHDYVDDRLDPVANYLGRVERLASSGGRVDAVTWNGPATKRTYHDDVDAAKLAVEARTKARYDGPQPPTETGP